MIASGRARTQITEIDLSARVPAYPGIYIAMTLKANKGTYEPSLVTSDSQLLKDYTIYEKVQVGDDLGFFNALAVLEKNNKLWVVRAEDRALYGGCVLNQDKPYNSIGITFNDGLHTVNLRHVTHEEEVMAETMYKSISTGEVFTFSSESINDLPEGLDNTSKYYLIPYDANSFSYRLATSYSDALEGKYIEFTGTGTTGIKLNFGYDRSNEELKDGLKNPASFQLDTSDGKMAGINATFTVDTNNSEISVDEEFWRILSTGTLLEVYGTDEDMPIATKALHQEDEVYAIVLPQEGTNKGKFKIQIAETYVDARSGFNIKFSSIAGKTFRLKVLNTAQETVVDSTSIDIVYDTITVDPKFYNLCEPNDVVKLTLSPGGEWPTVSGVANLNNEDNYYIIKAAEENVIQLTTSKFGNPINFTGVLNDTDTLTIAFTKKKITSNATIDLSKDTLDVGETYYSETETGYPCVVSSTGTLPKGLTSNTTYYVIKTKTEGLIKLASTAINAELGIPVDIFDAGTFDDLLGGSHIIFDTHNTQYSGFNQGCLLITTKTPTDEDIYIQTTHYPYGDEETWTQDEAAIARTLGIPGTFQLRVFKKYEDGSIIEIERWLMSRRKDCQDDNHSNIYVEEVARRSSYINVYDNLNVAEDVYPCNQTSILKLGGGYNGDASTTGDRIIAIQKLASVRKYTISLIIDSGYTVVPYQQALISLCESRQFTAALLSTRLSDELSANALKDVLYYRDYELITSTSYAALYSPHIKIYDKFNNREIYVSPVGHVAANISWTGENLELWYPVAGNTRGVLNVLGVAREWNEAEEDELYNDGINPIDFDVNKGIRIWGQKTLLRKHTALDRLNVRLLLIYIEPQIKEFLDDFLFELNDELTRSMIVSGINAYMTGIKARRGVYDYSVVCDSSNNSDEDIDNYKLNVDIYIQPTKAIEYIDCKIIITPTGSSFSITV